MKTRAQTKRTRRSLWRTAIRRVRRLLKLVRLSSGRPAAGSTPSRAGAPDAWQVLRRSLGAKRARRAKMRTVELPVSAIAPPNGPVSTGYSAFQALSRRQLYPTNREESPAGAGLSQGGLFRRCDLFDLCSFGFGLFAIFIGGFRSRSIRPARRSCTTCACVSTACSDFQVQSNPHRGRPIIAFASQRRGLQSEGRT